MNTTELKSLIGKEVIIYPGDAITKKGIILDINQGGILFKITHIEGRSSQYEVGKLHFISYSLNLTFREE